MPVALRFADIFSYCEGVIWLMIATAAEVPPVVGLSSFLFLSFSFISACVLGIFDLEFEW